MWDQDTILKKVLQIAKKHDLHPRYIDEYVDLCRHSSTGPVAAQYHKVDSWDKGKVLVIGDAGDDCPNPKILKKQSDYEMLSGDVGSNIPWLRAEGKTFGHRNPAQLFLLPDKIDDSEGWKDVEELIAYASNNKGK